MPDLFDWFGLSSFAYATLATELTVWLNTKRSAIQRYFPLRNEFSITIPKKSFLGGSPVLLLVIGGDF